MASPKPTPMQLGFIVAGAVGGAVLSMGILGIGGMLGGAIIGGGAGIGAIPYSRAVQKQKKEQSGDG